jgi:hypothetical protein
MRFVKKIWKNRQSDHPSRRTLIDVNSGNSQTVDVQRAEGTVLQDGDAFDANNMNDLEDRIESSFEEFDNQLNGFSFGITSDGKAGYKRGASSEIIPFKTTEVYYLGGGTSFDIKAKLPNVDYRSLTANNFIVSAGSLGRGGSLYTGYISDMGQEQGGGGSYWKSYNPSTGIFTCGGNSCYVKTYQRSYGPNQGTFTATMGIGGVYLVIGEVKNA